MTRDLLHDELERLDRWGFTVVSSRTTSARPCGWVTGVGAHQPARRVAAEIPVELPRAEAGDPAAAKLVAEITGRLREEVRRHATD